MNNKQTPLHYDDSSIDWNDARRTIRNQLLHKLAPIEAAQLDDLVQEACVRLLRTSRKETVESPTGLAVTIAQRTAIDYIRRRRRAAMVFEPMGPGTLNRASTEDREPEFVRDPHQQISFIVLEFFRTQKKSCCDLAKQFFNEKDWKSVASEMGLSHEGVRTRWSRCMGVLRKEISRDANLGFLREWSESC